MGFGIDKLLKLDKPIGTVYMSTDSCLIKVADTAPSNTKRADKIANETAKTGKVAAMVAVMSIFVERNASRAELILEMRSLLASRKKVLSFSRKISANQETFLRKKAGF
jgi:hypothetical protein